jgi:hypothetical protein
MGEGRAATRRTDGENGAGLPLTSGPSERRKRGVRALLLGDFRMASTAAGDSGYYPLICPSHGQVPKKVRFPQGVQGV